MAPILSIVGCVILVATTLYKYILVPAFISPLSKLPTAHPLCSVTSLWFSRQRKKQRELKTIYGAHQKYGPIVRLAPDEVSVVSCEGLRQIYTAGLEKTSFYSGSAGFENFGVPNLVSMVDHKPHSIQKRMISNLYANSNIQRSQDIDELSRKIVFDRFLPMIQESAKRTEDVDVFKLFQYFGTDFMSAFSFGTAHYTDFLRDEQTRKQYFSEWDAIRFSDDLSNKNFMESVVMKLCKEVLAAESRGEAKSGTHPIAFLRLYSQMTEMAKAEGLTLSQEDIIRRCASEMLDHIIATHETTGTALTYAAYHLSLNPSVQTALRSELSTLQPAISPSSGIILPSPASIDRLPLLEAIVKETLRLHAPAPCRQPRAVPAGGMQLHGFYIPAGTTVSSNAYSLHRNEAVFPRSFEWLPHRWVLNDQASDVEKSANVEEMKRWFWAFGSGGRMCIGSNLAMQRK